MILVLLQVNNDCVLSVISVVSEMGQSSWGDATSYLSRPYIYTINDWRGQQIGSIPRGMILVLL